MQHRGVAFALLPCGRRRGEAQSRNAKAAYTLSNVNIWLEECRKFYDHLLARGYPGRAIDTTFRKVSLIQQSKLLD